MTSPRSSQAGISTRMNPGCAIVPSPACSDVVAAGCGGPATAADDASAKAASGRASGAVFDCKAPEEAEKSGEEAAASPVLPPWRSVTRSSASPAGESVSGGASDCAVSVDAGVPVRSAAGSESVGAGANTSESETIRRPRPPPPAQRLPHPQYASARATPLVYAPGQAGLAGRRRASYAALLLAAQPLRPQGRAA